MVGKRGEWLLLLLLSSARDVRGMAFANHSLQSCFFQKELFGVLIVFQYLNMDCMNIILSDLSKLSLSFITKT